MGSGDQINFVFCKMGLDEKGINLNDLTMMLSLFLDIYFYVHVISSPVKLIDVNHPVKMFQVGSILKRVSHSKINRDKKSYLGLDCPISYVIYVAVAGDIMRQGITASVAMVLTYCSQEHSDFNTRRVTIATETKRPPFTKRHFQIKCIFLNGNIWILFKISLKFVPKIPINKIPGLVQIMVWHQATNHNLNQCWLVYWRLHASLGLN